jgi:hypothetical protein
MFDPLRSDPRLQKLASGSDYRTPAKGKLKRLPRRPESEWLELEIIADNLSKAGWSCGCVSAFDSEGRTIWIVDAHRGDGKRLVVHADEKRTTFLELESAIRRLRRIFLDRLT